MYKQLNVEKVLNIVERMKALAEELESEVASTSTETVEETTATVGETEIIEHEGLKLKRVDREAREGDYVRVQHEDGKCFKPNKIYGPVSNGSVKADSSVRDDDFEIADVYNGLYGRTPSTVEVFEVVDVQAEKLPFPEIVEEKPKLTANQQRALVIQEAKQFLASKIKDGIVKIGEKDYKVHFHRKGKTISCILNDLETGYTTYVNKANCHPQDVFNEHIGQAIALGGIIGTPKKMFLKAVQPDEVIVGMKVCSKNFKTIYEVTAFHPEEKLGGKYGRSIAINGVNYPGWVGTKQVTIIDDTNAQYKDI